MMKKSAKCISILIIIIFSSTNLPAQILTDVVFLKDGSILKGKITEYKTDEYIRIEITGGNLVTIEMKEVKAISKPSNNRQSWMFNARYNGYFNLTETGFLISGNYYNPLSFSLLVNNGYFFKNRLALSAGTGYEFINISTFPLMINISYDLLKTNYSPFLFLTGGYSIPIDGNKGYYYYDYKSGWLSIAGIGFKNYFNDNTALVISFGYRYQILTSFYKKYLPPDYTNYTLTKRIEYMNRLALYAGIQFR